MLALEIDFLTGNVVAANAEKTALDWPPQPDRVFSALVASWAARGGRADERTALEWLERQSPPRILAGNVARRTIATVFVPPNDVTSEKTIPAMRLRQARQFPTGRPDEPQVRVIWPENADRQTRSALDALARDTAYVGHSSSLTRCRFLEGDFDLAKTQAPRSTVYPGRLAELERLFKKGLRPTPGEPVISTLPERAVTNASHFAQDWESRWLVFADDGGQAPDLLACVTVCKTLRDALLKKYQSAYGRTPPEWLSGHAADSSPTSLPHAAFVPLADVGWEHSQGRLMGAALILPSTIPSQELDAVVRGLRRESGEEGCGIDLYFPGGAHWRLTVQSAAPSRASLSPARWVKTARLWATATPLVLDRFPKKRDPDERTREIEDIVRDACVNIGLPTPAFVMTAQASVVSGAPPVALERDAPAWQLWHTSRSLKGRYLTHAMIGFDRDVQGPVLLGAGRHAGLGFCLPVRETNP